MDNIEALKTPRALEKFLTNLAYLVDREDMEEEYDNQILFQKESVFGLFIRKAHSEFLTLPANRLHDLFMAFSEYCSNCPKDTFLFDSTSRQGWISEHNISEFLRSQAEMIESGVLHTFLRNVEQHASGIPYTHQVKYLNYARSKEHVNSVYHLHAYFNSSINKGVGVQYALLNLGILEYKFGHSTSALFAFNDALTAARQNNDEYCLQEIQYWINACRKSHAFHDYSVFTDHYLHNMKELKYARDMICKGGPNQHIFKTLYKTSINIIMKDIENMDRVQNLTTTLAWLRCGNSVLASSYLELAKNSNDGRVEDIEKTVLVNAKMLEFAGKPQMALDLIDAFIANYSRESEMLLDWKMIRSSLLMQSNNRKRKYLDHNGLLLYTKFPIDSEHYLDGMLRTVQDLLNVKEYEKALAIICQTETFIRKKEKESRLPDILILKASLYMHMGHNQDAIPILQEAMSQSITANDAKNYYTAVIKLSEIYICLNMPELRQKAIAMLECIFPKVSLIDQVKHT
ncbi:hypothetical protein G6F63_006090 [Rhizopus arrhizus]|nr:hypothetical protein G6F63_006090 [Rhizopus arrhizus]